LEPGLKTPLVPGPIPAGTNVKDQRPFL